jgi:threonine dehydrogenase-like Zn-dependent dehydrogenase
MNAVHIVAPGKLEYKPSVLTPLGPGRVRICVSVAAVCGSDLKNISAPFATPTIPGHEFSGVVIEVAKEVDASIYVGQRVTAFPMESCLRCDFCRGGKYRDCVSKRSLGFQLPGVFAEQVTVASRFLIPLVNGISFEQGALVEHLSCGYRLAKEIEELALPTSSHIVIIGDGPIALADLQFLAALGYKNTTVVGKHFARLDLAEQLGAGRTFQCDDLASISELLGSVDVCVLAAPADLALAGVLPLLRENAVFFPQTRVTNANVLGLLRSSTVRWGRAFAYEFNDFTTVMRLILDRKIRTDVLISRGLDLSSFDTQYSDVLADKGAAKTVLINRNFDAIVHEYNARSL